MATDVRRARVREWHKNKYHSDPGGILCIRCNCAIGALGDTAASVARVVAYLKQTESL